MARWLGAGRGNRSTGERLSRPLEGAKPARRGLHLLSPLFGSDTATAPVASLRLLVIRRVRSSPSRCASSVIRERWPRSGAVSGRRQLCVPAPRPSVQRGPRKDPVADRLWCSHPGDPMPVGRAALAAIEGDEVDAICRRLHRRNVRIAQQDTASAWEPPVLGDRDKRRAHEGKRRSGSPGLTDVRHEARHMTREARRQWRLFSTNGGTRHRARQCRDANEQPSRFSAFASH